jgi:glycine/D-amino acid oxidase-like deaminating enzyme
MVEFALMANVTDDAAPEAGMLPAPFQPVHTYWTLVPPEAGEATDSVMLVPEANQPLDGEGESYAEVTVR